MLLLNPVLTTAFHSTPHLERSKEEVDAFWDVPYATVEGDRLAVYCLDGQVPMGPTRYGVARTIAAAEQLAVATLGTWVAQRARPVVRRCDDGMFVVLKPASRPWGDSEVLDEFPDKATATEYLVGVLARG